MIMVMSHILLVRYLSALSNIFQVLRSDWVTVTRRANQNLNNFKEVNKNELPRNLVNTQRKDWKV